MEKDIEIPLALCEDEAVCFIADRHHLTPQKLLEYFRLWEGDGRAEADRTQLLRLEDNEVEILRGLANSNNFKFRKCETCRS